MTLLTAPLQALFNFNFYRQAGRSPLSKCFLYLLYLCLIFTVVFFFIFVFRIMPLVDDIVSWMKADMPVITWTPEGISIDKPSPYVMTHSKFGPLITFDMSKSEVTPEEMGKSSVLVTSKKIFVSEQGAGSLRTYDLTKPSQEANQAVSPAKVDAEAIQKFYNVLKPWLYGLMFVAVFFFFFVWKLLAALFYSWVGLLINFLSKPRLSYDAIFKISIFAITPWFVFQTVSGVVPFLNLLSRNFFASFLITSVYLFLAFKNVKQDPAYTTES